MTAPTIRRTTPDGERCSADPATLTPPPATSSVALTLDGAGWAAPEIVGAMRWTPPADTREG